VVIIYSCWHLIFKPFCLTQKQDETQIQKTCFVVTQIIEQKNPERRKLFKTQQSNVPENNFTLSD